MLDVYRRSLTPKSIVDVVPAEILQALMQGFYYGHRAGMVLIYDDGINSKGRPDLKQLYPTDKDSESRGGFEYFNPFCAEFRKDPSRNQMCEACDIQRARSNYDGTTLAIRYQCHMGLIDMTIPLRVSGKVRGVIYGGQKIADDPVSIAKINAQVTRKAKDKETHLNRLTGENKQTPEELDAFEDRFKTFASTLQSTVEHFHERMRVNAQHEALLEVSEELGRAPADNQEAWQASAVQLLNELSQLADNAPVWLLARRGSRYESLAVSSQVSQSGLTLRVAHLIDTPLDSAVRYSIRTLGELAESLRSGTTCNAVTLLRSDCVVSAMETASVLLLVGIELNKLHEGIFSGCCQVLSYPAGITLLFRRLEEQQEDHEQSTAFAGHHLKTPLTIAQWDLEEALEIASTDTNRGLQYRRLLQSALTQISRGLSDAKLLMATADLNRPTKINVSEILETLAKDFQGKAKRRSITIRILRKPNSPVYVQAIDYQLRVALSNLFDNAVKYSYENKTVDVSVSVIDTARSARGKTQSFIQIDLQNYGVGFSEKDREELFDHGVRISTGNPTREREGQGIGLWQARTFIESAGGTLDIKSVVVVPRANNSGGMHRVTVSCHIPKAK